MSFRNLAIMVTRRCNMECAHCSVESSPRLKQQPGLEELLTRLRDGVQAGARQVLLTGGEPMIRAQEVLALLQEAKKLGARGAMTSNAFWGRNPEKAYQTLLDLRQAGLTSLNLSYDRFHREFQGPEPLVNVLRAAQQQAFRVSVVVTRTRDDQEVDSLIEPFRAFPNVAFRFYDVQPVGAARNLEGSSLHGLQPGFCNACSSPAITDDGRLVACNGPSYFAPSHSALALGRLEDSPFEHLLQRHQEDPILETIRTQGPARLAQELVGFEGFDLKPHYSGMCQLCNHICSDENAVRELRQRLTAPELVAERAAIAQVIERAREGGSLSRPVVNSLGVAQVVFARMVGRKHPREESVLGRGDLDWVRLANYLVACGLERYTLEGFASQRGILPKIFLNALESAALRSGLRELLYREALRHLAETLLRSGIEAVLLKGGAAIARGSQRTAGDIDLWVAPQNAETLREILLQQGWQEMPGQPGARHHLAPIHYRGIPLEIHTRLMPKFWGLPEAEMLQERQSLSNAQYAPLAVLSPEAALLHCMVHCSKHLFSHGLKAAWDCHEILAQGSNLNWTKIESWAGALPMPQTFWLPLRVFAQDLGFPVPPIPAPATGSSGSRRERAITHFARGQLYSHLENARERNPFVRIALLLAIQETPTGLLQALLRLWQEPSVSEGAPVNARQLGQQFRQAARILVRTLRGQPL